MKKIIVFFFMIAALYSAAQTSCENSAPFCASGVSGVTFPATTSITTAQTGPYYDCLGSTPNPAWYYLQVSASGSLDILIQGTLTSGPGSDVDFICWGPFNSLANICNSLTAGNVVDCSYSGSSTETLNITNGVSGQYYMVLITNYANIQQDIIFDQFSGNGTTNCSLLSSNSKICAGSAATIVATNSGSLTGPTYSLSNGQTSSTGSFVVTPTVTTNYTAYVTGVNGVNVSVTQTALSTVTVTAQPSVAPTVTNTTCFVDTNVVKLGLTFIPSIPGPLPSYTVDWSPIPLGVSNGTQTYVSGHIPPGPYAVTVTAVGGCTATANFSVNPIPDPAIISLVPLNVSHTVTCAQPTIMITSLIATNNYTWSNNIIAPKTGAQAMFDNTAAGNWTVFAENPTSHCTTTKTFTVGIDQVVPSATVTPLTQNITCTATPITVTVTASPTVNISHNIISPQTTTFVSTSYSNLYVPGGTGTYTDCAVNDANGCSTCHTFTVTSNQVFPTFGVLSPQHFTIGCNSTSAAIVYIDNPQVGGGGTGSYTLLSQGNSVSPSGTLSNNTQYTLTTPGSYTLIVRDAANSCDTKASISIISNTAQPNISADIVRGGLILNCFEPKITLVGQSLTPGVGYYWNLPTFPNTLPGDSLTVNANSVSPTNSVIGVYTLNVTNNVSTCKSTSFVPIYQNIYPPVAAASGLKLITCATRTITLNNQSTSTIPDNPNFSKGKAIAAIKWEGPSPQLPRYLSTSYVAATVGNYTITARDENNGCVSTGTFNVDDGRIFPSVKSYNDTLSCGSVAGTLSLQIENFTPAEQNYEWKNGSALAGPTGSNGFPQFTVTSLGVYYVTVTNIKNGCAITASAQLLSDSITASVDAYPLQGYAPLSVTLYNNSSSTTGPQNIYGIWDFGNGRDTSTTTSNLSTTMTYSLPGTYTVVLYVNKGSCMDSAMKVIHVDIPSELSIPNIFTPNGDGVNDLFFLKATNVESISALIYDRWGHVVYKIDSDTGNIAWDGKNQFGKDVAEGTYFYMIKTTGKDAKEYNKKGTINVVR